MTINAENAIQTSEATKILAPVIKNYNENLALSLFSTE